MNPEGVLIDEFTFNNDYAGIHDLASKLTPEDRVVMESLRKILNYLGGYWVFTAEVET